jgi:hypothetical protein
MWRHSNRKMRRLCRKGSRSRLISGSHQGLSFAAWDSSPAALAHSPAQPLLHVQWHQAGHFAKAEVIPRQSLAAHLLRALKAAENASKRALKRLNLALFRTFALLLCGDFAPETSAIRLCFGVQTIHRPFRTPMALLSGAFSPLIGVHVCTVVQFFLWRSGCPRSLV